MNQPTYSITQSNGTVVTVVVPPSPTPPTVIGYRARQQSDRLDLLGNFYLQDATTFWKFCDANDAMVPDALATHSQIAVPQKGT